MFLEDTFLSILPQAKYKDYRSKSQDLHCPDIQLREVNLLYRFKEQIKIRFERLSTYTFLGQRSDTSTQIQCEDFRSFLQNIPRESVSLILTDPPWTDGNAYFEKAQLYHPWINYSLSADYLRLDNEFVVTDAPSRKLQHNLDRWWLDLREFFDKSCNVLCDDAFLALFFRPIPASNWLYNLNRIKLVARQAGFEPLLSIDVGSSDPSMRIQQSAAYVFSTDVVMLFLKLHPDTRRIFHGDLDIDQTVYQVAECLQEEKRGPFTKAEWRSRIANKFIELSVPNLNQPSFEAKLSILFDRYCDQVSHGLHLTKAQTPFSGHLFDLPAIERLFTYVPHIIDDLTSGGKTFNYDTFLLSLATYVENGSRSLISQIQSVDMKALIEVYAEPLDHGRYFRRRALPILPAGIKNVVELDPYDFEAFVAKLMEAQGFTQIGLLGRSGDRGIDVIGRDPLNKLTVVQCKRYITNNVSAEPIQRLHSFAVTRSAERMIVITTSDFTPQARDEARHTGVELINGSTLLTLIATHMPDWGGE